MPLSPPREEDGKWQHDLNKSFSQPFYLHAPALERSFNSGSISAVDDDDKSTSLFPCMVSFHRGTKPRFAQNADAHLRIRYRWNGINKGVVQLSSSLHSPLLVYAFPCHLVGTICKTQKYKADEIKGFFSVFLRFCTK